MNSTVIPYLVKGFFILCSLQFFPAFSGAAEDCQHPVGRLVSIQGEAQVQHDGQADWQAVLLDAKLCPGDMLRVLANGRAAVVFGDETVLRIDQNSTINFNKPSKDPASVLEIIRGLLHIFSHRPRTLKVVTPYVNGVVEGTEFLVSVGADASVINVFEGRVAAVNQQGRLNLSSGESAIAKKGTAPRAVAVVRPRDAVAWTLYYPEIIPPYPGLTKIEKAGPVRQAAANLSIGRVDAARRALAKILKKDPDNSEALALSSIIETVGNNKDRALQLALRAVKNNPASASGNLALSYAYQALFDVPAALKVLQKAAEYSPKNSLVQARLAELYLAVGQYDKAQQAALEAVSLNPGTALAPTILGFVYLIRVEIDEALAAFNEAIHLDSASPLARLGLGLAKIRAGRLEEGRADIEIAAALDPGNSLIRSYLGKAYFEEKRNSEARRQYSIAKKLDPADPTPWFYDAIRKQTTNRPVEALHDLQRSIALNDNRAVYRSRLLLDSDLAARSAGLARIYSDLGFNQLARVEGWKSVTADPANYSAHRFLADAYGTLPNHEISRVSELLQSQLLQPLNVTPVQPRLAESNITIQEGAGPTTPSFNEFNPLFLRDRVALLASGVAGSNDIFGDELVVSGVEGRLSYSVGQFHYQTDGIRDNSDWQQDIYSLFMQAMISPAASVMLELRHREKDFGDIAYVFDPADFDSALRQSEKTKSARIGFRYDLQPNSTLIGTAIISNNDGDAATEFEDITTDISSDSDNWMAEMQHIYKGQHFNLQSGAGFLSADESDATIISYPFDISLQENKKTEHTNVYSYAQIDLPHNILATIGLSGDKLDSPVKDRNELNPKFGLTWQPVTSTLIRLAAFRTVTRRLVYAQTIEPTFVAGFNQFLGDYESSASWLYGAGIDQTFSEDLHGGMEFSHRDHDVFYTNLLSDEEQVEKDDWHEDTGSAYLYWSPFRWSALGLEYYYEHFSRDRFGDIQKSRELTNHRLIPKILFFHDSGLNAEIKANYVAQKGEFGTVSDGFSKDEDTFLVFDLALSYRLPKRYGIFKLEVKNILDEEFHFVDIDPTNPRYLPERQIIGSLTVAF